MMVEPEDGIIGDSGLRREYVLHWPRREAC